MTKDHELDFRVHQFVGGVDGQLEHTAQQEIHESEEQRPNLLRERGPILRKAQVDARSVVSVPFTMDEQIVAATHVQLHQDFGDELPARSERVGFVGLDVGLAGVEGARVRTHDVLGGLIREFNVAA
jgi:hypothetical protein